MPAIYKDTEEQRAERKREAAKRSYDKRKAERAAAASRVVRDDDDDHLPATPAYLAEQAKKRAERELAARQEAEAVRLLEAAAAGELSLDDEPTPMRAAPPPPLERVSAAPRTPPRMRVVQPSEVSPRSLRAQDYVAPAPRDDDDTVSKAQIVATLQVLVISSRRKADKARTSADPFAHSLESGVTKGLETALQLVSELLAD